MTKERAQSSDSADVLSMSMFASRNEYENALRRAAFDEKLPLGDQVPGALREAFFELFIHGWNAGRTALVVPSPWIRVEDRMPPKNEEVLLCCKEQSLPFTGQWTDSRHDDKGWCYPGEVLAMTDYDEVTITYWMPLPDHPVFSEAA